MTNALDGQGVPHATHLAIIPDPETALGADLSGGKLLGHMNRANPHWAALGAQTEALLVFTGPHAYVSPTIYQLVPAAPTWNFTAVHLRGILRKIDSLEDTLAVVQATVRAFEAAFGDGWDMRDSVDYFRRIVSGVGAFRFEVTEAHSMFKLSQEQEPEIRQRVLQCFAARPSGRHNEVAGLMARLAEKEPVM
jgi:transcriptional regulator